ncbi:hypothetical protein CXG81DRAFT_23750 [Caulochytrium protostelioides]|uniref:Uncharacterized protein n=1 Tax=Caulochytrium protostelioides TaxID=1555241 RepID=A0A4P9WXN2_9FUNG|nr:hypothetical protein CAUPRSCDRAFT_11290 [Caulochytrium protostelioides]RKP03638.1 hypothetical protein CXG81DRAFT_23750 [Caulochytrium protostelioides]|eukprot:RKP03638.1 hypothetical protein CXG81DRAFT_23750 [Caulochytrium protostelioides]
MSRRTSTSSDSLGQKIKSIFKHDDSESKHHTTHTGSGAGVGYNQPVQGTNSRLNQPMNATSGVTPNPTGGVPGVGGVQPSYTDANRLHNDNLTQANHAHGTTGTHNPLTSNTTGTHNPLSSNTGNTHNPLTSNTAGTHNPLSGNTIHNTSPNATHLPGQAGHHHAGAGTAAAATAAGVAAAGHEHNHHVTGHHHESHLPGTHHDQHHLSSTSSGTSSTTGAAWGTDEMPKELLRQRPKSVVEHVVQADPVTRTKVVKLEEIHVTPVHQHIHDTAELRTDYVHGHESVAVEGKVYDEGTTIVEDGKVYENDSALSREEILRRAEEARRAARLAAPDVVEERESQILHAPLNVHERGTHEINKIQVDVLDRTVTEKDVHAKKELHVHKHKHQVTPGVDAALSSITDSARD